MRSLTASMKEVRDPGQFQVSEDLSAGVTLLEASAGTGKTHTIAGLAVRFLAEGTPVGRLLVVTFTRSATSELRERVRTRLVETEAVLRAELAAQRKGTPLRLRQAQAGGDSRADQLWDLLLTGSPEQLAKRQHALAVALAEFDASMITTIHGFCEQMLMALGTAGGCGLNLQFSEDMSALVDEVVEDFYLRKFAECKRAPFGLREARRIVGEAFENRYAAIEPQDAVPGSSEGMRSSLARKGRQEVIRRARRAGLIGWDDQIDRLRWALAGPMGQVAIDRLRRRFAVVLVDEFQDTDPAQWDIFRSAFAGDKAPLLLIGDPKQAIYSFRGADVGAYLSAAAGSDRLLTLATNWRSDRPLLQALDRVFDGMALGHLSIPYRRVQAAPGHSGAAIVGGPSPEPLRFRLAHRGDGLFQLGKGGTAGAEEARSLIAADLADEAVRFLDSRVTVLVEAGSRRVMPADLAVLVRTNREASTIHAALMDAGVPAVIFDTGSVFGTEAARDWLSMLEALEQPAVTTRSKNLAITPLLGWSPSTLARSGQEAADALSSILHRWAVILGEHGIASLSETVIRETDLVARQLSTAGGKRYLTDLRHIAELLNAAAVGPKSGPRALSAWLRRRMAEVAQDARSEERSRRLDSDAAAVQILTIHRSKGLEYPVVYLPYLWLAFSDRDQLPVYHDPDHGDVRTIDVGGDRPEGYQRHRLLSGDERRDEELRLAYVGFTRARHRVVVWWATAGSTSKSPLARLLLGRRVHGALSERTAKFRSDEEVERAMRSLSSASAGSIGVERVGRPQGLSWNPEPIPCPRFAVSRFDRSLDTVWKRWSYTALTARAPRDEREPSAVTSEAEDLGLAGGGDEDDPASSPADPQYLAGGHPIGDHPMVAESAAAGGRSDHEVVSPMDALPAGRSFGVLIHAVLQEVDFAAEDLGEELGRVLDGVGGKDVAGERYATLRSALEKVISTPLGPLAGGGRLRDIKRADRIDELGFELPVLGGVTPADHASADHASADHASAGDSHRAAAVTTRQVAACIRRWLHSDHPLADYPERLEDPSLGQAMRGYLTGSIDMVARFPASDGEPRYIVVDYKTNRLAPSGETLTDAHYKPQRLVEAMFAHHYPLQAVLYSVALHRYLRWRMPRYRPERHLGGVLYLFVRGMSGPKTLAAGELCPGVFSWLPPAEMVRELSDLFDSLPGGEVSPIKDGSKETSARPSPTPSGQVRVCD